MFTERIDRLLPSYTPFHLTSYWTYEMHTGVLPQGSTGVTFVTNQSQEGQGPKVLDCLPDVLRCTCDGSGVCTWIHAGQTATIHLVDVVVREEESRLVFDPAIPEGGSNKAVIRYDILADEIGLAAVRDVILQVADSAGSIVHRTGGLPVASQVEWRGPAQPGIFVAAIGLLVDTARGMQDSLARKLFPQAITWVAVDDLEVRLDDENPDLTRYQLDDFAFVINETSPLLAPEAPEEVNARARLKPTGLNGVHVLTKLERGLTIAVQGPGRVDKLERHNCPSPGCTFLYPLAKANEGGHPVDVVLSTPHGLLIAPRIKNMSVLRADFSAVGMGKSVEGSEVLGDLEDLMVENCADVAELSCKIYLKTNKEFSALSPLCDDLALASCALMFRTLGEIPVLRYSGLYDMSWIRDGGYCAHHRALIIQMLSFFGDVTGDVAEEPEPLECVD